MPAIQRQLPPPVEMTMPFVQVLGRRRTSREFAEQPVDAALLSAVLWACAGQTSEEGRRTVPSALDMREVEVFVFDQMGVWHYDAKTNTLDQRTSGDHRGETTTGQEFVAKAPVSLIFIANMNRIDPRVSEPVFAQLAGIDAGCMLQAAQMACTAMGLASVPRASFDADAIRKAAGLDEKYLPMMALTLGFSA